MTGSTSKHQEGTTAFLSEQGLTLASIDGPPADTKHFTIMPTVDVITNPRLAHLRLHGRDPKAYLTGKTVAERFHYNYSDAELDNVVGRAHDLARQADEVHIVFNNNARDFAPKAAERLRQKLGQIVQRPTIEKQADLFLIVLSDGTETGHLPLRSDRSRRLQHRLPQQIGWIDFQCRGDTQQRVQARNTEPSLHVTNHLVRKACLGGH